MTVAANITVYLVALAFFGIGGNGDEITDKVAYILLLNQCLGSVTFCVRIRIRGSVPHPWIRIQLRIRLLYSVTLRMQKKFYSYFFL
jgi:hypothetical protein